MAGIRPGDSAAAEVLRSSWGVAALPEPAATGVSRNTWRVEGTFWLTHSDPTEAGRFLRETRLLRALPVTLARHNAPWRVPEVVPTLTGESLAATRDGVWLLSRNVPGEEPQMQEASTYPALARMLAELHAVLEAVPTSLAVCEQGAVERSRELVHSYGTSSFRPATEHADERRAVGAIAEWLAPRLDELAALPRQLTHGDWIPPNIKLTAHGWAVLDWEFARPDPVVMDLGQSCSTILMWSGLSSPATHIENLVERYCGHSGREVSIENVRSAMALYWLQNYDHWRERQATVGGFADVLARQPERLLAVGGFVGAL
jgi:Ser/Thr protein kinase RdoA (MazF antagonist)